MTALERQTLKSEIQHLTRPLWRMLIITVVLTVSTGAVFKVIHDRNDRSTEAKHVAHNR